MPPSYRWIHHGEDIAATAAPTRETDADAGPTARVVALLVVPRGIEASAAFIAFIAFIAFRSTTRGSELGVTGLVVSQSVRAQSWPRTGRDLEHWRAERTGESARSVQQALPGAYSRRFSSISSRALARGHGTGRRRQG